MTEGRGVGIEQRIIAEFGEAESAKIIQLAAALMTVPAAPPPESVVPPGRSRVATVAVRRSDADQAGGEEIIQRTIEAVVCPADPSLPGKAAAVVAALKSIAPRNPVETSLAGLFVSMQAAAFDCLAIARQASFSARLSMTAPICVLVTSPTVFELATLSRFRL
jgi:hypothetical protein